MKPLVFTLQRPPHAPGAPEVLVASPRREVVEAMAQLVQQRAQLSVAEADLQGLLRAAGALRGGTG